MLWVLFIWGVGGRVEEKTKGENQRVLLLFWGAILANIHLVTSEMCHDFKLQRLTDAAFAWLTVSDNHNFRTLLGVTQNLPALAPAEHAEHLTLRHWVGSMSAQKPVDYQKWIQ